MATKRGVGTGLGKMGKENELGEDTNTSPPGAAREEFEQFERSLLFPEPT